MWTCSDILKHIKPWGSCFWPMNTLSQTSTISELSTESQSKTVLRAQSCPTIKQRAVDLQTSPCSQETSSLMTQEAPSVVPSDKFFVEHSKLVPENGQCHGIKFSGLCGPMSQTSSTQYLITVSEKH